MKRRSFCRLAVTALTGSIWVADERANGASKSTLILPTSRYDWVILYWMPYDNDLSHFGEPIVDMLARGTRGSNILVVIQSDYLRHTNMRRRQLFDGTVSELSILGEDSSDISNFSAYLAWASQAFEAEHWAVIVAGHGGKINEISPDDHSGSGDLRTWMKVDQLASAINSFNRILDKKLDFLFFQNCNKATLEVIYETRDCAHYTLASQLILGVPGYFYEDFLESLKETPVGGFEAAKVIMNLERREMYHTLTLVDNQSLKILPEKLSNVIKSVLHDSSFTSSISDLPAYYYFGERHCDVLLLLEHLSEVSGQGFDEVIQFSHFLNSSVIAYHKTGGEIFGVPFDFTNASDLCGLGLYVPETQQSISRYSSLSLYQEVDLLTLFRSIELPES